jgi:hypothetical protein
MTSVEHMTDLSKQEPSEIMHLVNDHIVKFISTSWYPEAHHQHSENWCNPWAYDLAMRIFLELVHADEHDHRRDTQENKTWNLICNLIALRVKVPKAWTANTYAIAGQISTWQLQHGQLVNLRADFSKNFSSIHAHAFECLQKSARKFTSWLLYFMQHLFLTAGVFPTPARTFAILFSTCKDISSIDGLRLESEPR